MGYGSRAMDLLLAYFQGELAAAGSVPSNSNISSSLPRPALGAASASAPASASLLEEVVAPTPSAALPPLLSALGSSSPPVVAYLGVSYGLTSALLSFWTRKRFQVCYVRQTAHDLTGEHSAIMLRATAAEEVQARQGWLERLVQDYQRRLLVLLGYALKGLPTSLALTLVDPDKRITAQGNNSQDDVPAQDSNVITTILPTPGNNLSLQSGGTSRSSSSRGSATTGPAPGDSSALPVHHGHLPVTASELLSVHLSYHDLQRLELYTRNLCDYHLILDLLPTLATLLFQHRLATRLSPLQAAILLGVGLQHRDVDSLVEELELPANQVLAFFNKTVRKVVSCLVALVEAYTAGTLPSGQRGVAQEVQVVQIESAVEAVHEEAREVLMQHADLAQHGLDEMQIAGLEQVQGKVKMREGAGGQIVSVPVTGTTGNSKKRKQGDDEVEKGAVQEKGEKKKKDKKHKKHKYLQE
jgi:N-acetyltransferase 10